MIRLDTTTRKLQIKLSGAITTNQLPVLVCYSDKTSTAYSGGSTPSNTNSTTAVDICAAPAASTIRDIDSILVWNADTATATVILLFNDNGTTYQLVSIQLAVGDQFVFTHGQGWKVLDSSGNTRTVDLRSFANPTSNIGLTAFNGLSTTTTAMRSDATPALSQSIVPTWTGVHTYSPSQAANTSADGIALENTGVATSGNQRYSPRMRLTGHGWKTNATAASQTVDWVLENIPVQDAASPFSLLNIASQINGGGYNTVGQYSSKGIQYIQANATNTSLDGLDLGFLPAVVLVGQDTVNSPALVMRSWGGLTNFISVVTAGGTQALPTATGAASNLFIFSGRGHDGSAYTGSKATLTFKTTNAWSGSDNSTQMLFRTVQEGTTTLVTGLTLFGASASVGTGNAVSTSATDGFLYIPTSAGIPTGTPTTRGSNVALEYDSVNNNLYVYNGAWKKVALT